jgi:hypothetical protein
MDIQAFVIHLPPNDNDHDFVPAAVATKRDRPASSFFFLFLSPGCDLDAEQHARTCCASTARSDVALQNPARKVDSAPEFLWNPRFTIRWGCFAVSQHLRRSPTNTRARTRTAQQGGADSPRTRRSPPTDRHTTAFSSTLGPMRPIFVTGRCLKHVATKSSAFYQYAHLGSARGLRRSPGAKSKCGKARLEQTDGWTFGTAQ